LKGRHDDEASKAEYQRAQRNGGQAADEEHTQERDGPGPPDPPRGAARLCSDLLANDRHPAPPDVDLEDEAKG
jgi:hypothetical protein